MRRRTGPLGVVALLALACGCGEPAQGKTASAEELYELCVMCHGQNGEGNADVNAPAIAGLPQWYVAAQLRKFKDGARGGHPKDYAGLQMRPMARSLATDESVDNIAGYIAGLSAASPAKTLEKGNAAKGKDLYAPCTACHGPDGKGVEALKGPPLIGQNDWYLRRQLKNFREGIRGAGPGDATGAQMAPMAATLTTDEAIDDVVAHIMTMK